jgi:xanthine dehydrogenase accessory factor
VARIYDALVADRVPPEQLARVHAPIGLDIGAVSPQEIAVSILAELIAVKHGKADAVASMKWTPHTLHAAPQGARAD